MLILLLSSTDRADLRSSLSKSTLEYINQKTNRFFHRNIRVR